MNLVISIDGNSTKDLNEALEEITSLVSEGITTGYSEGYHFDVSDKSKPIEHSQINMPTQFYTPIKLKNNNSQFGDH